MHRLEGHVCMFCLISFKLYLLLVVPWGTMMTFMTLILFNLYWPFVLAFIILKYHLVAFNVLGLLIFLCTFEILVNNPSHKWSGLLQHVLEKTFEFVRKETLSIRSLDNWWTYKACYEIFDAKFIGGD